jgi:hypothetical protein
VATSGLIAALFEMPSLFCTRYLIAIDLRIGLVESFLRKHHTNSAPDRPGGTNAGKAKMVAIGSERTGTLLPTQS